MLFEINCHSDVIDRPEAKILLIVSTLATASGTPVSSRHLFLLDNKRQHQLKYFLDFQIFLYKLGIVFDNVYFIFVFILFIFLGKGVFSHSQVIKYFILCSIKFIDDSYHYCKEGNIPKYFYQQSKHVR